jgi:hypothetical protein
MFSFLIFVFKAIVLVRFPRAAIIPVL